MNPIPEGPQAGQPEPRRQWADIPAELRERPQWCLAGPDKRPLKLDHSPASSTDPSTWADFESVAKAAAKDGYGMGYMLCDADPFTCIDLDIKPDTPSDDISRYESIVEHLDSYTERSRSGRGLHVWVRAAIGKGRRRDGVEVYSQQRFIICTGNVVRAQPIAERQALLANMVSQLAPVAEAIALTGDSQPNWAFAEEALLDGGELGRLFRGDWQGRYASQSDADLALVKLLVPHTESPAQCWGTFRLSILGSREKAGRTDYARSTLSLLSPTLQPAETSRNTGRRSPLLSLRVQPARCRDIAGATYVSLLTRT